jgi:prolyl 4-hydroxylase
MFEHPLPTRIEYDIPTLTPTGSERGRLSATDHEMLRAFYRERKLHAQHEDLPKYIPLTTSNLLELSPQIKQHLHDQFHPICSAWIDHQYQLIPTFVYGLRTYTDGASLTAHRDRQRTHIVSVIVQVDQDVDEDWPLYLENHQGTWDKVILKPGDYILYEGCRLEHGRMEKLRGREFRNVFIHYALGEKLK